MSTSSSVPTTVDSSDNTQSTRPPPRPSRRRDKPQLSCTLCRKRKLKCDRAQPCGTCVLRGLSPSCSYVSLNTSERSDRTSSRPTTAPVHIQDRIGQLEGMVISLMSNLNATRSTVKSPTKTGSQPNILPSNARSETDPKKLNQDPSELLDSVGRISLENDETSYVEGTHWSAILDGIAELKDCFEDDEESAQQQLLVKEASDTVRTELLFGLSEPVTKQEILAAIPSRPIVDRLITKCFNNMDLAPVIIHSPSFLKEYEQFWDHPMETPIMWIGLLFAIMCLASLFQQFSPAEFGPLPYLQSATDAHRPVQIYRKKTIQCLTLGNYTKGVPYTIETLLLYMIIEDVRSDDTQVGLWILLGIIVRLALRMGFHRDASHFPRISPFHGEMRRRIWAIIFLFDVTASAQVGLPRLIRESHSDTAEPRNLLDEDFGKNSNELPPARPDSVQTAVIFFVYKNKIISVYGMISDLVTSTQPSPYAEIMRLDRVLHDTYKAIPSWLHMRPMSKSIMDSVETITRRIYVSLVFNKAKCTLHRKYLLPGRIESRYAYSRTTCIEAALNILQSQCIMDQESQAGGRLYQDRQKLSALVKTEFLLATIILCLDLNDEITMEASSDSQGYNTGTGTRDAVIQALNGAYLIWLKSIDSSREAQKAAETLRLVLGKAQRMRKNRTGELRGTPGNMATTGTSGTDAPLGMFTAAIFGGSIAVALPMLTRISDRPSWKVSGPAMPSSSDFLSATAIPSPSTNIPEVVSLDLDTYSSFSDVGASSFEMDNWEFGYQTQSIDEIFDTSQDFPGIFDIPMS